MGEQEIAKKVTKQKTDKRKVKGCRTNLIKIYYNIINGLAKLAGA